MCGARAGWESTLPSTSTLSFGYSLLPRVSFLFVCIIIFIVPRSRFVFRSACLLGLLIDSGGSFGVVRWVSLLAYRGSVKQTNKDNSEWIFLLSAREKR